MNKEASNFLHNYATENAKKTIDNELFEKLQNYGVFTVGEKQFYERQLVLFALKDFSEKAVADFQSSLIEKMEEEKEQKDFVGKFQDESERGYVQGLQKAIELIKNHK